MSFDSASFTGIDGKGGAAAVFRPPAPRPGEATSGASFVRFLGQIGQQKMLILKNEPEKLLKAKGYRLKANRTEPESEAEKLLKVRSCTSRAWSAATAS